MAANSNSRGIASLGKRVLNQIWSPNSTDLTHSSALSASPLIFRRATHSLYEKNPDDHTHHSFVPDDVIQPESDKYWAPQPQTGVFGPASADQSPLAGEKRGFHPSPAADAAAGVDSVLEQKAWFRPTSLEDLEKTSP